MHEFEKNLAGMKAGIESYVFHPYLRQYIIPPNIDEDKLLILISIVDQLELSPYQKDTIVKAIMLMYVALDTHDHVTDILVDETSMKIRQLTVLAGDYYSGLYYKLLAEIGDIEIIKMLSEGVKNINEHKVLIYHKDQGHLNAIMNSLKTVEFSLIEKLTSYYGITKWNEELSSFLLAKRLIAEKKQYEQTGTSVVYDAIDRLTCSNYRKEKIALHQKELILTCEGYLEYLKNLMEKKINKVQQFNSLLEERMIEMIQHHYPREKSFVEEG
ncbi:heptaprenyl diphosphate synthase component 1 [Bacillus sp. V3B]|uniref:heptaprenyl diphosphate synthase component 1 n=1 Tax=Bacillus sp. V3B TaxID=2804915 RepID=UPI00210956B8|nr:heptaprenyl diphosphate synthase component 1 [Bacillus sp. V3B]MCQ6273876.1 heptaprenyl diphosphate synthase component 1 [Bacillus sp. V3B]